MFISTGVTARNPNYEDTKSPAHQANVMISILLAEFSILGALLLDMVITIELNIDFMVLMGLCLQWLIGGILVWAGMRKMSMPEV